jgi:hypothetical protein
MNTNHNLFELNNNLIDNNCSDTSKLQITTATSQEVQNIISIQNN